MTWSHTRPLPHTRVLLNGEIGAYSDVAQYELVLSIESCTEEGGAVVVDGDSVEVDITAYSDDIMSTASSVTLISHISSLASCERSTFTIDPGTSAVHHQARELRMTVAVQDVDGKPVDISPQQLTVWWRSLGSDSFMNLTLPYVQDERIRHLYHSEVPLSDRNRPGEFELKVLLHDAFTSLSASGGRRVACSLPPQFISVGCDEGFAISSSGSVCERIPSIWIRLGPAIASVLAVVAIVCYVGRLAWQRTERARRCALCRCGQATLLRGMCFGSFRRVGRSLIFLNCAG
jgi:hypothetical protein